MKDLLFLRLSIFAMLTVILLPACDKNRPDAPNRNNPPVLELPGADFTLRVLDHERGRHPDSAYVFEGAWRDGHFWFGREKRDTMQLNITPDNALVLEIQSGDPAFAGVNAASSARCIDVVPDTADRGRFHLEWVAEGRSEITLWNGEGSARREIRLTVTSRREIPLEGIRIRLDGQERILCSDVPFGGHFSFDPVSQRKEYARYYAEFHGFTREDPTRHVDFEIAGPVPLNANTGTLHIALDEVGLVDRGAFYEALPPHRWLKAYGLYEGNLARNPDFRWLPPFVVRKPEQEGVWRADLQDISLAYFQDPAYTLNPQDLRERYAWVWPQAYGISFIFSVAEGDRIEKRDGLFYFDKVHQIRIVFRDTPAIEWEEYY